MVVPSSLCSELVCFMWPRRSFLAQPSSLDRDGPHVARRGGARRSSKCGNRKSILGRRNHPRRTAARRTLRMSFDLNEAVFHQQGTYLQDKAVRYEQACMDQL